jgi:hypothetical protein
VQADLGEDAKPCDATVAAEDETQCKSADDGYKAFGPCT